MIVLDYKDRRPLYEQIVEKFRELIIRGVLPKDMQMPSVRSQAMQLSINPNTMQRAYSELERQGYIYTVKGRGSFVADVEELCQVRQLQWKEKFSELVKEGYTLGIGRTEMEKMLEHFESDENFTVRMNQEETNEKQNEKRGSEL